MSMAHFLILSLCLSLVLSHDLHPRQAPGGGPPPPMGGGGGGPTMGGGTMMSVANYNYSESTKSAESDALIISWVKATGKNTKYNAINNVNKIQYSSKYVYISCSTVPSYSIGPWLANPNTPSDQNYTFQFPRVPVQNTGNKTTVSLGNIGAWINGVGMYNADDGQSILGWKRNAYVFESISFDSCGGHPQQSGAYHHHVIPYCLFNYRDSTKHSPILGFAFDGYPVYGPFGYSTANNANSAIKRMVSSFKTRNITSRTTLSNGTSVTGPAINSSYPLGAFLDDFEYVAGLGDLDYYGGRTCVTPEYPGGTYAYFLSSDSSGNPAYPYTLGLKYYGIIIENNIYSGKVSPTEAVSTYYVYSKSSFVSSSLIMLLITIVLSIN